MEDGSGGAWQQFSWNCTRMTLFDVYSSLNSPSRSCWAGEWNAIDAALVIAAFITSRPQDIAGGRNVRPLLWGISSPAGVGMYLIEERLQTRTVMEIHLTYCLSRHETRAKSSIGRSKYIVILSLKALPASGKLCGKWFPESLALVSPSWIFFYWLLPWLSLQESLHEQFPALCYWHPKLFPLKQPHFQSIFPSPPFKLLPLLPLHSPFAPCGRMNICSFKIWGRHENTQPWREDRLVSQAVLHHSLDPLPWLRSITMA